MKFNLSVPSKTFLLGEYLATQGGTAIIANTSPRFILEVDSASTDQAPTMTGISNHAPAQKFYNRHKKTFKKVNINFIDPHHGQGGLGASSAQYALLIALREGLSQWDLQRYYKNFLPNIAFKYLDEYINDSWDGEGTRPSGTDMISQLAGQISIVESNIKRLKQTPWTFDNLAFLLVRTGQKLATHEHLKNVGIIPGSILQQVCRLALDSLETKNEKAFLTAIWAYSEMLKQMGALTPHSEDLLKKINANQNILAAKGCGAMGADVLLLIFNKENLLNVKELVASLNLQIVASSLDLTSGLTFTPAESKRLQPADEART